MKYEFYGEKINFLKFIIKQHKVRINFKKLRTIIK